MPRLSWIPAVAAPLVALLLGACQIGEKRTASDRCSDVAAAFCHRAFECFSAEERAPLMVTDTEDGCVTQTELMSKCATVTDATFCSGGQTYSPAQHEACIDQLESATCDQIRSKEGTTACFQVCPAT